MSALHTHWLTKSSSLLMALLLLASCSQKEKHTPPATYTCPMHPSVVSDKAGACPVCGMTLVNKVTGINKIKITEEANRQLQPPNEAVITSVKTIKAERREISVHLATQGIVTYDTRNISTVPARVSGRLEKVVVKSAYQSLTRGQKLAEIYSPELINAQRELLFLLDNDAANHDLIQSAKNKIQLLGASEAQLAALIEGKKILNTFPILSPYSGYLLVNDEPSATRSVSASGTPVDGGMNTMDAVATSSAAVSVNATSQANTLVREGSYVAAGQTLFTMINHASLRIEINLPVSQAGSIKKGNKFQLHLGDNRETEATVDLIQPFFTEGEQFIKLRAYFEHSNDLRIGELVKAIFNVPSAESLWLPREAVLDLGIRQIVFVKEGYVLKPKTITTGTKADGWVEVRHGLADSDEVAANAQYLVDSESFIKPDLK